MMCSLGLSVTFLICRALRPHSGTPGRHDAYLYSRCYVIGLPAVRTRSICLLRKKGGDDGSLHSRFSRQGRSSVVLSRASDPRPMTPEMEFKHTHALANLVQPVRIPSIPQIRPVDITQTLNPLTTKLCWHLASSVLSLWRCGSSRYIPRINNTARRQLEPKKNNLLFPQSPTPTPPSFLSLLFPTLAVR
ncbi:hypothetical protein C8F01DRAFT_441566 [Mycena amicta]|nr:hypothetical protein C8F01DRAFT_441566 [Mycena amicta]